MALIGVLSILNSCKKEVVEKISPSIYFAVEPNFLSTDSVLNLNQKVSVKIYASSEGSAITLFNFKIYDGEKVTSVDSGLNTSAFSKEITFTKGLATHERWVFAVRNKDMQWDSVSLSVDLKPGWQFGPITTVTGIQLGAQQNNSFGSFYSISQNLVATLAIGANSSSFYDLCYYFDNTGDMNTLASPGANISTSIFDLSSWAVKNEARFMQTTLTASDFDNCHNDSLIISNTFVYQSGKRKCKLLAPGDVYSFIRGDYKGLIKFTQVVGAESGNVVMDIKYQPLTDKR